MARTIFIVHNLTQAKSALEATRELGGRAVLVSPPGAAAYLGALYFREMLAEAAEAVPGVDFLGVLDCGCDPGFALNALRHGIKGICLDAPPEVMAKIADIAALLGAEILNLAELKEQQA